MVVQKGQGGGAPLPPQACGRFQSDDCPYSALSAHSQRLQTLGLMVGEITHDLNNVLSVALGQLELLAATKDFTPEQAVKQINLIHDAISNGGGICRSVLTYAGKAEPVVGRVDCGDLFTSLRAFFKVAVAKNTTLTFVCEPNLPVLRGDTNQLQQIFLNLLMNASEAIGDKPGRIRFDARVETRDDGIIGVRATVSDSGCGMDEDTRSRLFEPFFTTKSRGRGLGLAAVKQLVEAMGGTIEVQSTSGQGTVFTVFLPGTPALELPPEAVAVDRLQDCDGPLLGRVLLVDDDDNLRRIGRDGLRRMGLDVLTACDGEEAVACFVKQGASIDLVLMDAVMPHMDGCEALRMIRSIDPDARIVMMSGYSETDLCSCMNEIKPDSMLLKPVPFDLLRQTVVQQLCALGRGAT